MPERSSKNELKLTDAYWRAANYLSVGQIYLYDNPLLKKPLSGKRSSRDASVTEESHPAWNLFMSI
jgi:phosphoketolase